MAGVTGARSGLPADLKNFVDRVRTATDKPLSVGFGISSTEQVKEVAGIADGVVVGSAFMNAVDEVHICIRFSAIPGERWGGGGVERSVACLGLSTLRDFHWKRRVVVCRKLRYK